MNVWQVDGSWSKDNKKPEILYLFRKYNIVFVGYKPERLYKIKIGDIVAITFKDKIVNIGIVLDLPVPITNFLFDDADLQLNIFDYAQFVKGFKVKLFESQIQLQSDETDSFKEITQEYNNDIFIQLLRNLSTDGDFDIKSMTYAIQQLFICNFQEIKELHIKNIPTSSQWIFLTGQNGYGKTSVLQAITIALFGNKDDAFVLDKNEKIAGYIEIKNKSERKINIIGSELFSKFTTFVAYGASRLNKNSKPVNSSKTFNLS